MVVPSETKNGIRIGYAFRLDTELLDTQSALGRPQGFLMTPSITYTSTGNIQTGDSYSLESDVYKDVDNQTQEFSNAWLKANGK